MKPRTAPRRPRSPARISRTSAPARPRARGERGGVAQARGFRLRSPHHPSPPPAASECSTCAGCSTTSSSTEFLHRGQIGLLSTCGRARRRGPPARRILAPDAMSRSLATYARFVKLEHTLFSLPLIVAGALIGRRPRARSPGGASRSLLWSRRRAGRAPSPWPIACSTARSTPAIRAPPRASCPAVACGSARPGRRRLPGSAHSCRHALPAADLPRALAHPDRCLRRLSVPQAFHAALSLGRRAGARALAARRLRRRDRHARRARARAAARRLRARLGRRLRRHLRHARRGARPRAGHPLAARGHRLAGRAPRVGGAPRARLRLLAWWSALQGAGLSIGRAWRRSRSCCSGAARGGPVELAFFRINAGSASWCWRSCGPVIAGL